VLTAKPKHPACRYVTSKGVCTLLYIANPNKFKALCRSHKEGRTKFVRKKNEKSPYKYRKNNNAANDIERFNTPAVLMAMFTVCVAFVDLRYRKLCF
jgi:hypothetical protein